jgi:hypothetical protein
MTLPDTSVDQELRGQIRDVIVAALRRKYISTSSHMSYTTGNAYQTVNLDDESVGGYRQDR